MNDVDRDECETLWWELLKILAHNNDTAVGRAILKKSVIDWILTAKRKWEKAAANAKLEEAVSIARQCNSGYGAAYYIRCRLLGEKP